MFDQDENLRNAISKLKARLAYLESILSRPPVTKTRWGMESRPSAGGGIRLHEDRQHVQERIAELETELLLSQYHRSIDPLTRNVVAQAAIEKKLAERGFYVQSTGESAAVEVRAEPQPTPNQLNKPNLNYRSPLRKAAYIFLLQKDTATDREICDWADQDGADVVKLPPTKNGDRSWAAAYLDEKLRPGLESAFSKVRGDMRACGLLPPLKRSR